MHSSVAMFTLLTTSISGGALTRGSGVPGEQPIRSFEIRFCLDLRDESHQFESQQGEETDA